MKKQTNTYQNYNTHKQNKKCTLLILLVIVSIFVLRCIVGYILQKPSANLDRLDINATILANGDIQVEEAFKYKLKGTHNGIFREYNQYGCNGYAIDGVTIIDEHNNEIVATEGYNQENNTYEFTDDDTLLKVYTKSKNESKTIKIKYTIFGAAKKYKDCSAIYWNFYDIADGEKVNSGTLNISLDGAEYADKNFFYKIYGSGKIKGKQTKDSVNIQFKNLTSKIEVQIRFQEDFLNNEAPSTYFTIEEFYSNKSDDITTWNFILYNIIIIVLIIVLYLLSKLYRYIDNMIFDKKLKKYRRKCNIDNSQRNDYVAIEPTPNIPPAYINFIYNDYNTDTNIIIDSLFYLVNKGVYTLHNPICDDKTQNKKDLVFIYTGKTKDIKDNHLKYLIKWLNSYDKGNGIDINNMYKKLNKTRYATRYVEHKRKFLNIIQKEIVKKGYVVVIRGKYVISNEFYNQWEDWKCYRYHIANRKRIDIASTITSDYIQPAIIYSLALNVNEDEMHKIMTNIADGIQQSIYVETLMTNMYQLQCLLNTFKDFDKQALTIYLHSNDSDSNDFDDYGSTSGDSSFGGGGGTSGTF